MNARESTARALDLAIDDPSRLDELEGEFGPAVHLLRRDADVQAHQPIPDADALRTRVLDGIVMMQTMDAERAVGRRRSSGGARFGRRVAFHAMCALVACGATAALAAQTPTQAGDLVRAATRTAAHAMNLPAPAPSARPQPKREQDEAPPQDTGRASEGAGGARDDMPHSTAPSADAGREHPARPDGRERHPDRELLDEQFVPGPGDRPMPGEPRPEGIQPPLDGRAPQPQPAPRPVGGEPQPLPQPGTAGPRPDGPAPLPAPNGGTQPPPRQPMPQPAPQPGMQPAPQPLPGTPPPPNG